MNTKCLKITVLFLLALPILAHSQSIPLSAYSPITQIPLQAKFITTDKLQQLYAVTPQNTVIKFTPDGREQYRFSNNTLGELGYVDATDPFNLLLYYPDYQLVVTLDRTLNQTASLHLLEAGVIQASAIGLGNDGNIWVYDEASFQLRQFSRRGEVLFESQNLSLVLPKAPQPIQLLARENFVYLNDPKQGILVFDTFGQYAKTIAIPDIMRFQVLDNRLIYKQDGQLQLYDLKSFRDATIALPEGVEAKDQVQIQQNRIFVQKQDAILIYDWK